MILDPDYWRNRYQTLISNREQIWEEFRSDKFEESWIQKRLSKHQWSIDEVLRHMIGSEIVYIQQPLDNSIKQYPKSVLAQWVGNVFFRLKEEDHLESHELIEAFKELEAVSIELLRILQKSDLEKQVTAPWREKVSYQNLLAHSIDHELSHLGQVNFMLTYFRGPPKFVESWGSTKLEDIEL